MKSFKFVYGDKFEIAYRDGELEINQSDEWGTWVGMVMLPMSALLAIHEETEKLYLLHNPSCNEVSKARTQLENARALKVPLNSDPSFEEALKAYMDISARHHEAFKCEIFH